MEKVYMHDLRAILELVRDMGKTFTQPDDDWTSIVFLFSEKGVHIAASVIEEGGKDMVAPALTRLARQVGATAAGMVMSQWVAEFTNDPIGLAGVEIAKSLGVRDLPGREEQVQVELFDGTRTEVWWAKIRRHPDRPPTLGPWREAMKEMKVLGGRFANLLERCLGK